MQDLNSNNDIESSDNPSKAPWENEKKILIRIANDNKELAKQAMAKLEAEQERFQQLLKEREQSWKGQIDSLQIEIKVLKATNSHQFPGSSFIL